MNTIQHDGKELINNNLYKVGKTVKLDTTSLEPLFSFAVSASLFAHRRACERSACELQFVHLVMFCSCHCSGNNEYS